MPLTVGCWLSTCFCDPPIPEFGPGTFDADIDAPEAWDLELGDPDYAVAVVDTGHDPTHLDLLGQWLVIDGSNVSGTGDPDIPVASPNSSHGVWISGIIAALTNNNEGIAGLSRDSRIVPVKAGPPLSTATAIAGLGFAAAQPEVSVINMSWNLKYSRELEEAIQMAYDADKLLVAAVEAEFGVGIKYPASDPLVMAVTATDRFDNRYCKANTAGVGEEISVAAPGHRIVTTHLASAGPENCQDQDYCSVSGTSFATAFVSGLGVLVKAANPSLTVDQIRRIIESTADDLGSVVGHDDEFGCGRINAFRAVCRAICPADLDAECEVGINDFLALLAAWGDCTDQCCPADLDEDGLVGINDFLYLLAEWGPCGLGPPPASLAEEVAAAGLTPAEWVLLVDCVVNGTDSESDNCACWIHHYMDCHRPPACVPDTVLCAGSDPLGHH